MDRFIGNNVKVVSVTEYFLKSSMDRFIGEPGSKK